jgi:hypothetical protein
MRLLILIAAVLALSACGKDGQAGTAQNADEGMTAESIVSNDVTAIDAVTGDAANMAADVDMNFGNLEAGSGETANESVSLKPTTSKSVSSKTPPARSAPPAESNATANTAANQE